MEGGTAADVKANAMMSPADEVRLKRMVICIPFIPCTYLFVQRSTRLQLSYVLRQIPSPLTPDLQLLVKSGEVTAAQAHAMLSPTADANEVCDPLACEPLLLVLLRGCVCCN